MIKKEAERKGNWVKPLLCFGLVVAILLSMAYFRKRSKLNVSLDIDFTQSNSQIFDCSNQRFLSSNYDWILIKFTSSSPTSGAVLVSLYVDANDDGIYVPTDHSRTLRPGEGVQSKLPYGKDAKKYRIIFERLTESIAVGSFSVVGGKPATGSPFW